VINLSGNFFTSIPTEIAEIKSISNLDLRGNLISKVTFENILSLRTVKKINLGWGSFFEELQKSKIQDQSSGIARSQSNPLKHQSKRSL